MVKFIILKIIKMVYWMAEEFLFMKMELKLLKEVLKMDKDVVYGRTIQKMV